MRELHNDGLPPVVLDSRSAKSWAEEIRRLRRTDMDWYENIQRGAGLAGNCRHAQENSRHSKEDWVNLKIVDL